MRPYTTVDEGLETWLASVERQLCDGEGFEVERPGRPPVRVGTGHPAFVIRLHGDEAVAALRSRDELRVAQAYVKGDLDLDGDIVAALNLRRILRDNHFLSYLWATFGQRAIFGQLNRDRQWISQHYDRDSEFYLQFLDKEFRCYSHGLFKDDAEPLESAVERKLRSAITACEIRPGSRVLDVGAGWGCFTQYAGRLGAKVTSLTLSQESERYSADLIAREELPCRVLRQHFFEHDPGHRYDAIVNLGTTEHLPDYRRTLDHYLKLLRPGGRIYLDAAAAPRKFAHSTAVRRLIWPGNTTPLHLSSYLAAVESTPFEVVECYNDRHHYMLTTRCWALNLEAASDDVVRRWGEPAYRQFRLYLWGCVQAFLTCKVSAYRLVLHLPGDDLRRLSGQRWGARNLSGHSPLGQGASRLWSRG